MTTTSTDIRTLARETDTRLAEIYEAKARIANRTAMLISSAHSLADDHGKWEFQGRRRVHVYQLTDAAAVERCRTGQVESWDTRSAAKVVADLDAAIAEIATLGAEEATLNAIYLTHRWSRFFVVNNSNGHIHYDLSSYRCSRTLTTSHGWTPALSGADEAEAVAALGPKLCTVCFPSAPVEWTIGEAKPAKCAGSGRSGRRVAGRLVECPECHTTQSRTPNGVVRAHKPLAV